MRVALERGETLEVALVENDRIVGTMSLELRGTGIGVGLRRSVGEILRRTEPTAVSTAGALARSTVGRGGAKKRAKNLSPEARRKMAEAQKRRWERYRKEKAKA